MKYKHITTAVLEELFKRAKDTAIQYSLNGPKGARAGGMGASLYTAEKNFFEGKNAQVDCGFGWCAEQAALMTAVTHNQPKVSALCIIADHGRLLSPCLKCHAFFRHVDRDNKKALVVLGDKKILTLEDCLAQKEFYC